MLILWNVQKEGKLKIGAGCPSKQWFCLKVKNADNDWSLRSVSSIEDAAAPTPRQTADSSTLTRSLSEPRQRCIIYIPLLRAMILVVNNDAWFLALSHSHCWGSGSIYAIDTTNHHLSIFCARSMLACNTFHVSPYERGLLSSLDLFLISSSDERLMVISIMSVSPNWMCLCSHWRLCPISCCESSNSSLSSHS